LLFPCFLSQRPYIQPFFSRTKQELLSLKKQNKTKGWRNTHTKILPCTSRSHSHPKKLITSKLSINIAFDQMGTATSSMAAKFAFFPPNPPSYTILVDEETGKLRLSSDVIHQRDNVDILKLCTKKGNEIVATYVKNPSASLTVLYSHGNAADIGQMYHIFTELSSHLNVNLMGWVSFIILINMYKKYWISW